MEQMLNSIDTCKRLALATNYNGNGMQDALTETSQGSSQTQLGGAFARKKYEKPEATLIDVGPIMDNSLSTSGNTTHNSGTQKDQPGPETGGDEAHGGGEDGSGEDLEAAKRWQWMDDPSY